MRYDQQCAAAVQAPDGTVRRCSRESIGGDPLYLTLIPVCSWHFDKARRQFAANLEDEIAELKQDAKRHECDGQAAVRAYMEEELDGQLARAERHRAASQVYYMRCGEFIKIGVSITPAYRLRTIREIGGVLSPDGLNLALTKLVATEPGGQSHERAMHRQFAHLRHTGEWFTETPELTAHIERIAA